jgi:hypothetical protein
VLHRIDEKWAASSNRHKLDRMVLQDFNRTDRKAEIEILCLTHRMPTCPVHTLSAGGLRRESRFVGFSGIPVCPQLGCP